MKLTDLNIKKIDLKSIDKTYPGQDILFKIGEIYRYESGIYAHGNIITKMDRIVSSIITEELDKVGCIEVTFPILQPKRIWEETGRWDNYTKDSDTMFTISNNLGEYGLAPTAEECAINFASYRLISSKNLPAIYYQIHTKFRKEIRTRGYLFRSREFKMMDAYSFDKDKDSMIMSYKKVREAYINIFKRLGLTVVPIAADNGAFGGDKSEEWMVLTPLGEDTILYNGSIGLNTEVMEKDNYQEYLKKEYNIDNIDDMKEYKAMELGHTFMLGSKYSLSSGLLYKDNENKDKEYYMGCYGIGIERIFTTVIEKAVIYDEDGTIKGLSLPYNISPYKVHIIYKDDKKDIAFNIYNNFINNNINAIIDDRDNYTIGNKINDCFVLGTPYLIVIGDNYDDKIEVESTKDGKKDIISISNIIDYFKSKKIS